MEGILIVLVGAIVAVLLVGIAVLFYDEGRKQRDLRRRPAFGIGRGHTGARSAPEQELEALAHNPGSFTVKPLPSVQAARFSAEWRRVQQRFTDDPSAAIADAHSLARDVMEARGYLVEGTESKMARVSVPLSSKTTGARIPSPGRTIAVKPERLNCDKRWSITVHCLKNCSKLRQRS